MLKYKTRKKIFGNAYLERLPQVQELDVMKDIFQGYGISIDFLSQAFCYLNILIKFIQFTDNQI